jgi:general secretion pathway protein A
MYIQYFGLRENPFALPPDPRYLYLGARHQEALAHLMYGITEGGGFVQLTGEVGTGKTMIVRALFERLPQAVDVALVLYPFLSVREFIASICDDLHIPRPPGDSLKAMIDALNTWLLANHAKGRRTVLVVDEAHKLPREVLEQIRMLTNLETTKEKLLQIILVGQPELNQLLARQDMRQLAQRITARYNLEPLTWEESCEYILHRCRVAGAQMPLFKRSALRSIHRLARGIPRLINLLCDRSLLGAYASGKSKVSGSFVRTSVTEIGPELPRWRPAWVALGVAVLAAAAIVLPAWYLWPLTGTSAAIAEAPVPEPAAPATSVSAIVAPAPEPLPTLEKLLADDNIPTDTDTAFTRLFSYWQKDYARFAGATGCDRAQQAGLSCLYESGTWNNLRQLNRPAIIELTDARGTRHHVLVSALKEESVALELGDRVREFAFAEVDRFWFGKYLALWSPPVGAEQTLRRGGRGPGVSWLREALNRAGLPTKSTRADVFDAELEATVKDFQRRHQVEEDGIVGKLTLIMLTTYDQTAPPLLAQSEHGTVRQ